MYFRWYMVLVLLYGLVGQIAGNPPCTRLSTVVGLRLWQNTFLSFHLSHWANKLPIALSRHTIPIRTAIVRTGLYGVVLLST